MCGGHLLPEPPRPPRLSYPIRRRLDIAPVISARLASRPATAHPLLTTRYSLLSALMSFSEFELADHLATLEREFWSHRRPPDRVREMVREGQRIAGHSIELFFIRPVWNDRSRTTEEPIAKLTYVRSQRRWRLYWMRGDLKWHAYPDHPTARSLAEALRIVHEDKRCCFFG